MWLILKLSVSGLLLRLGIFLVLFVFVIAADVLFDMVLHHIDSDPDDEGEPEDVDGLQSGQQSKGDALAEPAFVLLRLPVELERSHILEIGEHGGEDDQIDVMPQVRPDDHEDGEEWDDDGGGDVVEGFGRLCRPPGQLFQYHLDLGEQRAYREEEIADIMGDVDSQAHVGEVEAIAQPDQRDGDDVMCHKLFEVLSRLLQLEHEHNGLLGPVAGLQQVVGLEHGLVAPVGEILKHANGIKIPDRRPVHDI